MWYVVIYRLISRGSCSIFHGKVSVLDTILEVGFMRRFMGIAFLMCIIIRYAKLIESLQGVQESSEEFLLFKVLPFCSKSNMCLVDSRLSVMKPKPVVRYQRGKFNVIVVETV